MTVKHPHIIITAGPNGTGKSTTAPSLLQGPLGVKEFVNAKKSGRTLLSAIKDRT